MICKVTGKIKYRTHKDAEDAMFLLYKRSKHECFGSYTCPNCNWWHLTSKYDNRTPYALDMFSTLPKPRYKKAKQRRGHTQPQVSTVKKKKEKFVPVYLPRDEYLRAIRQLHNKPASLWLRVKDFLGRAWRSILLYTYRLDESPD